MNLSVPFVRRPVMTAVLCLSSILFGVMAYYQLPVNDLPPVDYPVIQVNVGYPGASPETVANNVATPLERQFMQINGLEMITSRSIQGQASLTLQFALDKSIDAAATDVQTAISASTGSLPVDLPSPPSFSKTNPNDQPIMYIALTSDSVTQGQLYDYASTQVGQRISIQRGVSRIQVFGVKSAVRIKADPSRMAARGITIDDLATAIRNGTAYSGAGQLDGVSGTSLLRPHAQLDSADGYRQLIVGGTNGQPIHLRDVATAVDSLSDERLQMRFWVRGYPVPAATVIVAVSRQAGANAVEVASRVRETLPVIANELPGSVKMTPIYDRSLSILNSLLDVQHTLFIAFVLVILVIYVFLGRATDTLIPVVALPLSILLTFIVMQLFGYSLDDRSRSEPHDLALLYIKSDDGQRQVPLKSLIIWHRNVGPQAVNHLNQFTSVTIFFNVKEGVPVGDATDFIERTAAEIVPTTLRGALLGEALTFKRTVRDLTLLMALAVFVMYVILAILYESYLHPLTVLSSLPVALVGGLLTLHLAHEQASLYAFVGMFMLMGIVKKNGIMIVDFAIQRVAAGATPVQAIHEASLARFRPIIMTTLAAVAGAVPIALGFGADGASRRPLGMVIVGGLVVSQFITLYITPVIYLYLEDFQERVLDRTSFFRATRHL